jgi:hypothetical protein
MHRLGLDSIVSPCPKEMTMETTHASTTYWSLKSDSSAFLALSIPVVLACVFVVSRLFTHLLNVAANGQ